LVCQGRGRRTIVPSLNENMYYFEVPIVVILWNKYTYASPSPEDEYWVLSMGESRIIAYLLAKRGGVYKEHPMKGKSWTLWEIWEWEHDPRKFL